jgi:hypothetical protein
MLKSPLLLTVLGLTWLAAAQEPDRAVLRNPDHPEMSKRAPDACRIRFETTKGRITLTIPDDPRQLSNTRGTVAYAFKDPNGRTTQMFISLTDNAATHDAEPFVPFARLIEGMDVADALYVEHGESAGGGIRGGKQDRLFAEGNAFLLREFPKLDYIKRATVLP